MGEKIIMNLYVCVECNNHHLYEDLKWDKYAEGHAKAVCSTKHCGSTSFELVEAETEG